VTERRGAEEARFEVAFQTASIPMTISRLADGRLLEVNDTACARLGYDRSEMIGRSATELGIMTPQDREGIVRAVQSHGIARDLEITFRRRDGGVRQGLLSASPIEVDGEPCLLTAIVDITDRLAAEEALRASEVRFTAAFTFAGVMMLISRLRDGLIVDVNQAFLEQTGFKREEVVGKTSTELSFFAHPEDRNRMAEILRRDGNLRDLEVPVTTREGELNYALLSADVTKLDGEPHLIMAIVNTTLRKRAEDALRTSGERYRNLVEQTADGVLLLDNDGRIVDANPALAELLGRSIDELLGRQWTDYFDPENLAEVPFWLPAHGEYKAYVAERRLRRPDSSTVDVEVHARQFAPGSHLGVVRDIGARKAAERERATIMLAMEQSPDSIVITDPAGAIVYANPAFEKATGFMRGELVGKNHGDVRSAKDPDFNSAVLAAVSRDGAWSGEVTSRAPNGSVRREAITLSAVYDASGAPVNYVAVQRDVTRERELEDQLHRAQRMDAMGQLAGGIAHDFNNLLTVVNGYAEILIGELEGDERIESALEIKRAGARAAELTRQILAFARRTKLAPQAMDVNVVVTSVGQMLARLLGAQVRLTSALSPRPAVVMADPGQLEQVLVNLAVNARDAMPDGGSLEIGVHLVEETAELGHAVAGPAVLLTVTDSGTGMDATTLERAFEPFFTTKQPGSGTGLGLATVFGIVHQSNGEVWAESSVGLGTTVSVLLPRVGSVPDALGGLRPASADVVHKATVLVVEDEPAVRAFVVSTLERAGYRVLVAGSPAEAVALTDGLSDSIDLLLTDMVMPETNGQALAERLVAVRPSLNVILMSGYDPGLAAGPIEGSFHFLAKPFGRDELIDAVSKILADG